MGTDMSIYGTSLHTTEVGYAFFMCDLFFANSLLCVIYHVNQTHDISNTS